MSGKTAVVPDPDAPLRVRARELGVQTSWFDVHHDVHHADDVTLERIIDVLEADRAAVWSTPRLAPALHLDASRPITVPARVERATIGERLALDVRHGDGRSLIDLPADLPFGCHTVTIDTDRGAAACVVVVAPAAMPRSAEFDRNRRAVRADLCALGGRQPAAVVPSSPPSRASDEVVRHRRRVDAAAVRDVPRRPVRSEPVLADQSAALERGVPRRRRACRRLRRRPSPARSTGGRSALDAARNSWKPRNGSTPTNAPTLRRSLRSTPTSPTTRGSSPIVTPPATRAPRNRTSSPSTSPTSSCGRSPPTRTRRRSHSTSRSVRTLRATRCGPTRRCSPVG